MWKATDSASKRTKQILKEHGENLVPHTAKDGELWPTRTDILNVPAGTYRLFHAGHHPVKVYDFIGWLPVNEIVEE